MGQALAAACRIGRTLSADRRGGDPLALAQDADVLVDFSAPAALEANLAAARAAGTPILIGTTGLDARRIMR